MLKINVREDFLLPHAVNYLNTASIGLVPQPVIEATEEFSKELSKNGTRALDEDQEVSIYDNLRNEGKKLFQCKNKDDIAVFNSVSEALNTVAWSIPFEGEKHKIITTDISFPSICYPWMRLAQNGKTTVEFIKNHDWLISEDEIIEKIDEYTKIIVLSHVEFLTGQIYDLKRITKYAHDNEALVVADGIQAAGAIPIDVQDTNIDVYIAGSYKWLIAPFGTSIMYIREDLYEKISPPFVGWRSVEDIWNFNPLQLNFAKTARKFEYSTSAYGVKVGLTKSIQYIRDIGIKNILNHNMRLANLLKSELEEIRSVNVIFPEKKSSICTFKFNNRNSHQINLILRKLEKPVEISIRQGLIRVSPHLYNTEEDILEFIDALKEIQR